jgi:hypothetical protein
MHLVQILLPVRDNDSKPYSPAFFASVNKILVGQFGGVTAYLQSPARGSWLNEGAEERDDVIMVEVMTECVESAWWGDFRSRLERDMRQKEIVIRALKMTRL